MSPHRLLNSALPARPSPAAALTFVRLPGLGGRELPRTLVIEDDVDWAELMLLLLRSAGGDAATVADGAGAMQAALAYRPDLIVSDIDLPNRDGYQLAEDFRRHAALAAVPLIAVTGRAEADTAERAARAGFSGLLLKPVHPDRLVHAVAELLAQTEN